MDLKERGMKKVKFYDKILIVFAISLVITIYSFFGNFRSLFSEVQQEMASVVSIFILIIMFSLLGIFILGMVYNAFIRGQYVLAFFNLLITFAPFYYYLRWLRKEFKEGNIRYKHKSRWDGFDLRLDE